MNNLKTISTLDDGDAISFDRGFYSHHGLITGNSNCIVMII